MKLAIIISMIMYPVLSVILLVFIDEKFYPYDILILCMGALNSLMAIINVFNAEDPYSFFVAEQERLKWSLEVFTESTAQSSLEKLKEEIKEIEADLKDGFCNPYEYADATMCLWDSGARAWKEAGRNEEEFLDEMFEAFKNKIKLNKSRTWKKNPDNSYSHVKDYDGHSILDFKKDDRIGPFHYNP